MIALGVLTQLPLPLPEALRGAGFFDLHVYREAAGIVLDGGALYHARFRLGLGFTYPPAAAVLFTLLRAVPVGVDELLVTGINLALTAAIAHAALRLAPPAIDDAHAARRTRLAWLAAAAALWTYPMIGAIGFGQIDLLVATLVVVDLTSGRQGSWGGLLVGIAAALKLTPLIFIPYLLLSRRPAMAARALGGFGLSIVFSFLVVPSDARAYWPFGAFDTSRVTGGGHHSGRGPANQSLHGVVLRLGGELPHLTTAWLGTSIVVGGVALLLAVRSSRRGDEDWGFALTAIAGLLISPISWPHHWVILLPGLVLALDRAARRAPGRTATGTRLGVIGVAAGSWSLAPVIAAHPVGAGLGIVGLVVGNGYVFVGLATIAAGALVDLRSPARTRPGARPPLRASVTGQGAVWVFSEAIRSSTPAPDVGLLAVRDRECG